MILTVFMHVYSRFIAVAGPLSASRFNVNVSIGTIAFSQDAILFTRFYDIPGHGVNVFHLFHARRVLRCLGTPSKKPPLKLVRAIKPWFYRCDARIS